jgi:hypothetical protein
MVGCATGVGPERAGADDGIVGVAVDVGDRREVEVDAGDCKLGSDQPAGVTREVEVIGGAERGRAEDWTAAPCVQAGDVAALLVDRDHRSRGGAVDRHSEACGGLGPTGCVGAEETDSTKPGGQQVGDLGRERRTGEGRQLHT